ncbi:MAG: ABC transporter permease [Thermoguttaceae bacterium]
MRAWWIMLMALGGLRRRPLRVVLTVLGVTIAAGSLYSMVGFALGLQRQAEAPFEKLDLLKNIEISSSRGGGSGDPDDPDDAASAGDRDDAGGSTGGKEEAVRGPTVDDALLARIEEIAGVAVAYPQFRLGNIEIRHGEKTQRCMAIGAPREVGLLGSGADLLVAGGFFDLDGKAQVLISEPMVESLGLGSPEAAIGKAVTLEASGLARREDDAFEYRTQELTATVAGVYQPPQPAIGPLARTVVLPVDILKDVPGAAFGMRGPGHGRADGPPRGYGRAIVRVEHPSDLVRVEKRLKDMGLHTQTAVGQLSEMRTFFVFLDVLLAAVGTVALVVAALGIINTLLMAVLERYQEIGTCKAIGASDGDIVVLFLTEAVLLGFLGGLGGLALGRVVSWGLEIGINIYARGQGVESPLTFFSFPLWLSLATVAFATVVAVLAGVWPAFRAARIDPIRALRGQ